MNEAEWLKCSDPELMLHCLWDHYPEMSWTERKPQLLIYAFMRAVQHHLSVECRDLIDLIEKRADGGVGLEELEAAFDEADRSGGEPELVFAIGYHDLGLACYYTSRILASSTGIEGTEEFERTRRNEVERQIACVRDIFGNPYRPVGLAPSWLRPAVVSLAQTIYDGRAFDQMPAVADALEREGCEDTEILAHCRGQGPHVRGCWVVDLLLGKK